MAELVRGVGDLPENDGEGRVARKLLEELPADWKLIPNVEIRDRNGRMYQVDCIVLAPHAVYVIEVKDWHGAIEGDDTTWVHNGSPRPSPNPGINRKAKILKDRIGAADSSLRPASVESFVVLASTPDRLHLSEGTRAHTRLLGEIVPALLDTSLVPGSPRDVRDLPERAAQVIAPLVFKRRPPSQIGSWRILETLGEDDQSTVYRVASALAAGAPPARLTVWHLSTYRMTPAERELRKSEVLRDYAAVARMGPHRLIVGDREAFEDGEDVVVVTDEPVGVPLALRVRSDPTIADDARLAWIADLAEAVAHAHAHGVVHRRITPETVLVVADGVRLSGFGHARIEVEGTIRHDPNSVEGRDARYLAPEVVARELGPATEQTDLFGLAAVAWTIWSGKPMPRNWQTSAEPLPRPEAMPDPLWHALAPLLDVVPARRTVTLDEFRSAVTAAIIESAAQPLAEPAAEPPVTPAEYPIGGFIADRYEVVEKLGAGGFAIVYRAVDTELGVERAVKVLDARAGKDPGVREVLALERVAHPNVVRVRSIDKTPTMPAQWYITSDIAPGEPLSVLGRLPLDEAVEVANQLLNACIAFHPAEDGGAGDAGIVHRDIKPSNVLYDRPSRHATLIDFNIASASGSTVVTRAGTPSHQPPDPNPDRWSPDPDLFGIGVLLFETLTGEHPYADGRHPSSGVRSLGEVLPSAPEALSQFLDRATSPRRADRFTSALAMRSELGAAMETPPAPHEIPAGDVTAPDGMGPRHAMDAPTIRVVPLGTDDQATAEVPPTTRGATSDDGNHEPRRRRSRQLALASAAVVLVVVGAVGGLLAMRGAEQPADSVTTSETSVPTSGVPSATTTSDSSTEAEPSGQHCPAGFPVKGNINDAGESIYHVVGGQFYDRTLPERCFVDPAAAEAAGFRPSER